MLLEQLNIFAESLKSLTRRLPELHSVQETLEKVQDASSSLEHSTTAVIGAYERSIQALERPNTISEGLFRLEVLLKEHTQRTETIIQKALGAVEQAAKKQSEMSEEVARLIVDAPMEVASARLVVTDRPEFQRMQHILEQRMDRMDHSVRETKATVDKFTERGNMITRLIKRLKQ